MEIKTMQNCRYTHTNLFIYVFVYSLIFIDTLNVFIKYCIMKKQYKKKIIIIKIFLFNKQKTMYF